MAQADCVNGVYYISLYSPSGAGSGYSFNGGQYGGSSGSSLPTTPGSFKMPINRPDTYTYYAVDQFLEAMEAPSSPQVTQAH